MPLVGNQFHPAARTKVVLFLSFKSSNFVEKHLSLLFVFTHALPLMPWAACDW
jgi:hypothetical protein